VVPAYNEAPVVGDVIRGLHEYFLNVVVVDDGSRDATSAEAIAAGARVVRHAINLGAGAATQTGLNFAMRDPAAHYFVTFDADGQHGARDAAAMVTRLREGTEHVLIGSRFLGSATNMSRRRRSLLTAARTFEYAMSGVRLTDAHNGLRAFSRDFGATLNLSQADFAHASQFLEQVKRSGLAFAEYPVTVTYTEYSRAKGQRNINSINIAVDVWLRHLLRSDG
jgi:glycosyltransferase involved in cell wall biosynthesis